MGKRDYAQSHSLGIAAFALAVLLGLTACEAKELRPVDKNETAEAFIERYVNEIDVGAIPAEFSQFWNARARQNLHDTPARLDKEMSQAVAMHRLLQRDNTLENVPAINDWEDEVNTVSYTYNLTQPEILVIPHLPNGGEAPWLQYQLTLEKEEGGWVVSGESLLR